VYQGKEDIGRNDVGQEPHGVIYLDDAPLC
jgi:hypothetical protein